MINYPKVDTRSIKYLHVSVNLMLTWTIIPLGEKKNKKVTSLYIDKRKSDGISRNVWKKHMVVCLFLPHPKEKSYARMNGFFNYSISVSSRVGNYFSLILCCVLGAS